MSRTVIARRLAGRDVLRSRCILRSVMTVGLSRERYTEGVEMVHSHFIGRAAIAAAIASALALPAPGLGVEIRFRSFSGSATMGPQFDAYAAKLADTSLKVIGPGNEIGFKKITPTPASP